MGQGKKSSPKNRRPRTPPLLKLFTKSLSHILNNEGLKLRDLRPSLGWKIRHKVSDNFLSKGASWFSGLRFYLVTFTYYLGKYRNIHLIARNETLRLGSRSYLRLLLHEVAAIVGDKMALSSEMRSRRPKIGRRPKCVFAHLGRRSLLTRQTTDMIALDPIHGTDSDHGFRGPSISEVDSLSDCYSQGEKDSSDYNHRKASALKETSHQRNLQEAGDDSYSYPDSVSLSSEEEYGKYDDF